MPCARFDASVGAGDGENTKSVGASLACLRVIAPLTFNEDSFRECMCEDAFESACAQRQSTAFAAMPIWHTDSYFYCLFVKAGKGSSDCLHSINNFWAASVLSVFALQWEHKPPSEQLLLSLGPVC